VGQFEEDLPFGLGFADLAGDLRAEANPPLGRRLGAAVVLFVARFCRKEEDFLAAAEGVD
jgi:hypothetical protein